MGMMGKFAVYHAFHDGLWVFREVIPIVAHIEGQSINTLTSSQVNQVVSALIVLGWDSRNCIPHQGAVLIPIQFFDWCHKIGFTYLSY